MKARLVGSESVYCAQWSDIYVHCCSNELALLKSSSVGLVQSGQHHLISKLICSSHDIAELKVT